MEEVSLGWRGSGAPHCSSAQGPPVAHSKRHRNCWLLSGCCVPGTELGSSEVSAHLLRPVFGGQLAPRFNGRLRFPWKEYPSARTRLSDLDLTQFPLSPLPQCCCPGPTTVPSSCFLAFLGPRPPQRPGCFPVASRTQVGPAEGHTALQAGRASGGLPSSPQGLLESSQESGGRKPAFCHKPRLATRRALGESCPMMCGVQRPKEAGIPTASLTPGASVRLGSQYRPLPGGLWWVRVTLGRDLSSPGCSCSFCTLGRGERPCLLACEQVKLLVLSAWCFPGRVGDRSGGW